MYNLKITWIRRFHMLKNYGTFPQDKLKYQLFFTSYRAAFLKICGSRIFIYFDIGHLQNYFVRNYSDSLHKYSEVDIFQIDNIHVVF